MRIANFIRQPSHGQQVERFYSSAFRSIPDRLAFQIEAFVVFLLLPMGIHINNNDNNRNNNKNNSNININNNDNNNAKWQR